MGANQGIYIQDSFPFGAFGCKQWSLSEMKRLLRWLRSLGYHQAAFGPWPVHFHEADSDYNILEVGGLMTSGLRAAPPFSPGARYCPEDQYLGTEKGLRKARQLRDAMAYAAEIGMEPWLVISGTIGPPQFCEEHPELLSPAADSNVFLDGLSLCPSNPKALEYLLAYNAAQLRYLESVRGVALFLRDAGGCNCAQCQPQDRAMADLAASYRDMIRQVRPDVTVALISWHIDVTEVPMLADSLPVDMPIFEAPRIHAMDVPQAEFVMRVRAWQEAGRRVEGWLEVQENPTALLPTVYPRRLADMVGLMKELGLRGIWGTSTQNPYLFPLNLWMVLKLWKEEGRSGDLVSMYLARSFGPESVGPGIHYLEATEKAWDLVQGDSQRDAGFLKIFVISMPRRMLPEQCIRNGVPDAFREDTEKALLYAEEAFSAAETLSDSIREYHALDANTIVASAEVFYWMVCLRHKKIPVLDALHRGDVEEAVRGWEQVEEAADQVVAACRNAPNTDILADHWRRLSQLPERLRSLRKLLPELAERKTFRDIVKPIEMREAYKRQPTG